MEQLIIYERLSLNRPRMVVGFEGWPDAGKVSTEVLGYLRDKLGARKVAEVKPDDFYIFQAPGVELLRPMASIQDGLVRHLTLPSTCFYAWQNDKGGPDLVLLLGVEPHMRWNEYAESVLAYAQELGVERLFTVGGVHNWVPHTAEPIISIVANEAGLAREVGRFGMDATTYTGPASMHTLLLWAGGKRGLPAASLWGHAPFYIQVANTKVCYGVLKALSAMLDLDIDLGAMKAASDELDRQVNAAMEEKPELKEYVNRLEEQYRLGAPYAEPLDQDVVEEVEDFLRRGKDDEE